MGAIVQIHVARALKALQCGFQKIEAFRREFYPEVELTILGHEKAMLDDAAKGLRRLGKILERILTKKRQRELGIAVLNEEPPG